MNFKKFAYPYLVWQVVFIVLPLLLIGYYGFFNGEIGDLSTYKFSLEGFKRFLTFHYLKILWKSVRLAFITTFFCLLIAYPTAYIISKMKLKNQQVAILLCVMPMWMNFLLRTYAWMTILSKKGVLNSIIVFLGIEGKNLLFTEGAVVLGMVYNFLPFMIMPIYSALAKMDLSLEEAAADLGADKKTSFLKVTLPLSMSGVITGIIMVFIPAISTFEISALLGGGKVSLIGNVIEQQFRVTGDWHFGAAISLVLMVLIVISAWVMNRFGDEEVAL